MSFNPTHLEALTAFGYTPQEAHFLYLVATHSGYFRARQFLGFTRARSGKRTKRFWLKLQARKHARAERFPTYGLVYHVFARQLYRHLGQENLRNRREHEIEYVQRRVDTFDFVLAHPGYNFLETEPEKVEYFGEVCGVPAHVLPSRTYEKQKGDGQESDEPAVRYFVDRFPMFVDRSSSGPVAVFSYIQPAEANLTKFARHLKQYLPLFRALPAFRFLYLARSSFHFTRARELFDSLVGAPLAGSSASDLLRYFQVQRTWESGQYAQVSEADLIFRNRAKERFSAARFEHLYDGWKSGRTTEKQIREEFPSDNGSHQVGFAAEVLEAAGTNFVADGVRLEPANPREAGVEDQRF